LTTVHIPSTLDYLAGAAFRYCANLSHFVCKEDSKFAEINNSLVNKIDKVLLCATNDTIIPVDGSVTSISSYAFASLGGIVDITVPGTITSIGDGAFSGCPNLTSVYLPDSVTYLPAQLFYQSSNLYDIRLPNTLTAIRSFAFGYSAITSLTLPATLTHFGGYFAAYCEKLESVTFLSTKAPVVDKTLDGEIKMFNGCKNLRTIRVGWSEGELEGAPWGAPLGEEVEIIYNYRGE
jgi:hypothetical protein